MGHATIPVPGPEGQEQKHPEPQHPALAPKPAPASGTTTYTLVTEPDQGLTPIYNLLSSAKKSIDMTMYELSDTTVTTMLAKAAGSGVTVRVILDQNNEKANNTTAYNTLTAGKVSVHWANPAYACTHQKTDVRAAGEGIETVLSVRCVMPAMPMAAALSSAHLSAILFPLRLRRLYIVRDADPAGDSAAASLIDRANAVGIETIILSPTLEDFNEDLRRLGVDALRPAIKAQIAPQDVARFLKLPAWAETGN